MDDPVEYWQRHLADDHARAEVLARVRRWLEAAAADTDETRRGFAAELTAIVSGCPE